MFLIFKYIPQILRSLNSKTFYKQKIQEDICILVWRKYIRFWIFLNLCIPKSKECIHLFRQILQNKVYLVYILISALVQETELILKTIYWIVEAACIYLIEIWFSGEKICFPAWFALSLAVPLHNHLPI